MITSLIPPIIKDKFWQASLCLAGVLLVWGMFENASLNRTIQKQKTEFAELGRILSEEREASASKLMLAQDKARRVAEELQETVDKQRKEANDTITDLRKQHGSISDRLRIAEARAKGLSNSLYGLSSSSKTSSLGQATNGGTDTLIPGTIGQEDVDEAFRADLIRTSLISCYALYDKARDSLAGMDSTARP